MKNRPGRRKRKFSKKSASLTIEFLERRVVLNADPTGGVLITGSPFEGQALTASNNIVDADGLGPISYQWKSASDPIRDATSPTYVLQDSDVGKVITVVATYTDLLGTEEVVSSQPTAVIESSFPPVRQSSAVSYSPEYTSINGRTFGYYVPESYDPSTPTPLLFMFHGAGGNSSEQSGGSAENGYYGWQTSAHENGFIVLFPESSGYFKTWNLGAGGSSSDLSFVDDMVDWATSNYNISTSQIFTTGHSWGAYFSYYVATFRSDDIAAFGAHSGGLGGAFFLGNTPSVPTGPNPTPTLNGIVLHAVDDGIVPYSNSQNLYDDLVANGHNVYNDGIGADGIIEVDGWGPDNHRYRKQHNQTQWDFFLSVAPDPVTSNQPPEFNQPLDLILNEDASPKSIALTGISSGNGVMQPVRVTATSSNPGLIPDPTVSYTNPSDTASLVVAPVANQHGTATITVTVEDGGLDNNLETADDNAMVSQAFVVTVTSVDDPGSFSGDTSATGSEDDSAITGTLVFTDAIDGDSLPNYSITSDSSNGTASVDATTGAWSYTPNANFNGSDSFTVTVADDEGHTETQIISLTVTSINDAGTFSGSTSATGLEDDTSITGTLIFTDAIDGDSAPSYTITSESNNGTASIDATSGAWLYTPNANFNGSDSFAVTVSDDEGHIETQIISLTVTSINDPGSFTGNTSATGSEDYTSITGTLAFTDAIDGDIAPNYTITSESSNGAASIDAITGAWSYTPKANFNGSDSFTVAVTDDEGHTETQVVNLIVEAVNDPGSFSGDTSATGSEDDSAITGTLTFTDAIDGDSLPNYSITSESSNGMASVDATTGAWSYTPKANFNGSDFFTVTVTDDDGHTETQIINLTVASVGDPGSFTGDTSATGSEDESAITGTLVFTDAIDGASAPNYTITSESSNGAAVIDAATGAWSYTPNTNFSGSDSFTVAVTDDEGHTETQVISLTVTSVNDPGSFSGDTSITGLEDDSAITGTLVFTDAIDGDSAPNYTITSESSNGMASIDATTGAWSYTPNANFNGSDSFTVTVTDDDGHTETQVINLTVASVGDPGSFTGDTSATGSEDESAITGTLVFTDAIDGASAPNYTITSESSNGAAVIDAATGAWSYTPNTNFSGSDSFTVAVTDDEGHTETQVISLTVTSVNDPGSFSGDTSITGLEDDSAITGTLVFTDAIDGDSAPNYTITSESSNGSASIDAITGVCSYTPNANFNGSDSFTVAVTDDDGYTETHVINLIVEAVNDTPTLDALTDVTRNEGDGEQTVSLTGITAGGGETQLLSITAVSDNAGLIPDPTVDFDSQSSTGTLKFTPAADQFGTATITVLVEDGGLDNDLGTQEDNGTVSRVFDVVLTPVNDEPVFDPVADLVLPENSLTQVLEITGISAGVGEDQPLQITTSSSNTSVVLHPTVTLRSVLGPDTRLITVTPVPEQYGIATITVTVEDGGLDLDLNTAEDNAMFSRTFDVTVTPDTDSPPSPVAPYGRMFIHETLSGDSLVSYQLPAVNVNGEAINGLPTRVTVTSSDTALIPDPTVLYASTNVPSSLSFTPAVNANGPATLSIQVEDGGPDNDFATTEDNRQATHQVEVNVLEVISNQGSAILAKDGTENLYANTQPVTYQEQQVQTNIAGFAAIGASSEDGENVLLVERSSVTNRLVTDDAWRINGLFNSLQNESSPVLDLTGREVSVDLNVVAVAGAYEINGARNPTLVVRRGQNYNFKLDVANHPFFLQTTGNGFQPENLYEQSFQGQGRTAGDHIWIVPADAPDKLYYQCEFHPVMFGKIIVVD